MPEPEDLCGHAPVRCLETLREVIPLRDEYRASIVATKQDLASDCLVRLAMIVATERLELAVIDEQQIRQAENPLHLAARVLRPVEARIEADLQAGIELLR